MIFIATPKQLPKDYFEYGIFEVDNNGTLISVGWANQIRDLTLYHTPTKPVQCMWGKEYYIRNFLKEIYKDCIILTPQSHPEYFI